MRNENPLTIIAHCGACTSLADNSLEALWLAVEEGTDMIELDLRRTKDGHIVVIHDATTYRMMGTGGSVDQMTLEEVKRLRGYQGERIATLREVLELSVPIIHEFKEQGMERELVDAIRDRPDDIVSSFEFASLQLVKEAAPGVKIGLLWNGEDWRGAIRNAVEVGAYSIHPSNYDVRPDLVEAAREAGLKVYVWSVGDARRAAVLKEWGVHGIMTYTPRQTRDVIAADD